MDVSMEWKLYFNFFQKKDKLDLKYRKQQVMALIKESDVTGAVPAEILPGLICPIEKVECKSAPVRPLALTNHFRTLKLDPMDLIVQYEGFEQHGHPLYD